MELVLIISPSYNSSYHITNAISSVIAQSFSNWELIIVDDCSSDNSVSIAQEFVEKDHRIKLIQLAENSGAACNDPL